LLTPKGELELAKAERHEYETLFLAPSLVSATGAAFLDRYYRQWYDIAGINFGIDRQTSFDLTELDLLWKSFTSA
jgi:hypothetical protein